VRARTNAAHRIDIIDIIDIIDSSRDV